MFLGRHAQHAFQFTADLKDLLGIRQHLASGLGQLQLASHPAKQRQAIGVFEQADLSADRLRREVQLLASANNAAGLGHDPEVMQLAVIKHQRRNTS